MARYTGPVCRLCRRENEKLFLKGERCLSSKCAFEHRAYAPGDHGKAGSGRGGTKVSDYNKQLRAKQKARRIYGVLERQFRRTFALAEKERGLTGLNLLQMLETRLDNVIYRMGFAENRAQARQLVTHGHFMVNGVRCDIPSMFVKPGDKITLCESSKNTTYFKELHEVAENRNCIGWITRDTKNLSGTILRLPERAEIDGNITEQLIVEYYSR